jgi:MFS transporter, ACS family, tartrate transporter
MGSKLTLEQQNETVSLIFRKLLPLLCVSYLIAHIDRINIGYASLTMNVDLKLSAVAYGFGASVFFLSYFLFEVPSNILMQKFGPRLWIARIMITWGLISAGMFLVQGETSFYVMRFLLGAAEAGFAPAVLYLFTLWFRKFNRSKAVGIWISTSMIGNLIAGPMSGAIMTYMNGTLGLAGWQWLFIIEGIPAVILAFIVLRYLPNSPREAKWLTEEQKEWITGAIEEENRLDGFTNEHISVFKALRNPKTIFLSLTFILMLIPSATMSVFLPRIVNEFATGLSVMQVSLLTMIPSLVMCIAFTAWGAHSDKKQERRWHLTTALLIVSAGLILSSFSWSLTVGIIGLVIYSIGLGGTSPVFLTMATDNMGPKEVAVGIALVNSVGQLGGFLGPNIFGMAQQITGNQSTSLLIMGCVPILTATAINLFFVIFKKERHKSSNGSITM